MPLTRLTASHLIAFTYQIIEPGAMPPSLLDNDGKRAPDGAADLGGHDMKETRGQRHSKSVFAFMKRGLANAA